MTEGAPRQTAPGRQRIRLRTPAGLLAAIPHLLGFCPASSLVVIGTRPPQAKVTITIRYDLPDPPDPRQADWIAAHAAGVLAAKQAEQAVAVGYGPTAPGHPGHRRTEGAHGMLPLTGISRRRFASS